MSDNMKLKVWHNECDYVAAESAEAATEIVRREYGYTDQDLKDYGPFESFDDDYMLSLIVDTDTEPFFETKTQSCSDWCKESGRGIFGSTEY